MKHTLQLIAILALATISTGCATPYMVDRGRDAADIFTASYGIGAGAKARVGPLQTGLFVNRDIGGLRGGIVRARWEPPRNESFAAREEIYVVWGADIFDPDIDLVDKRNKVVGDVQLGPIAYPFYIDWFGNTPRRPQSFTQIEAAVGLGPTLRLGFNPGELLDFILGWFHIDIYNDDIERKKSNKILEDTGTSAPDPQD
jgi:hypothetical protein